MIQRNENMIEEPYWKPKGGGYNGLFPKELNHSWLKRLTYTPSWRYSKVAIMKLILKMCNLKRIFANFSKSFIKLWNTLFKILKLGSQTWVYWSLSRILNRISLLWTSLKGIWGLQKTVNNVQIFLEIIHDGKFT